MNTPSDHEAQRYAAIQAQMKALLDAAANDRDPITGLLRALLYAELYERNEQTHQRAMQESTEKPEEPQS